MFHVKPCCLRLYKACAGLCISNATSHRNGAQISLFFGPQIMWMQLAGTELLLALHRAAKFPADPPQPPSTTRMLREGRASPGSFTLQPTGDLHLSASTCGCVRGRAGMGADFPHCVRHHPPLLLLCSGKRNSSAQLLRDPAGHQLQPQGGGWSVQGSGTEPSPPETAPLPWLPGDRSETRDKEGKK